MNWTTFNTHKMSPDKAFETLCSQLFENWCKSEYAGLISSFAVVNGAGGDGGVESYLTLIDDKVVGLQAKWFPNTIGSSEIGQIRNSIKTAMRIRPNITRCLEIWHHRRLVQLNRAIQKTIDGMRSFKK